MKDKIKSSNLISHCDVLYSLSSTLEKIKTRIIQDGNKQHVTVETQLELLDQLSKFDLGRFLIQNGGLNGYWTHYVLAHSHYGRTAKKNNLGETFSNLERAFLDKFPTTLATQQRFEIFLHENQKEVKNHAKLACIPCGMLGELLYLDYQGATDIELIGIDLDVLAMEQARSLAQAKQLDTKIKLLQQDAWHLNFTNELNLISSNGLNIYEADESRVTELYRQFYQALTPGGKLVTSFFTYPPLFHDKTEWRMDQVDAEMLLLQRIIFVDILNVKFNCFMTTTQMQQLLESIGFKNIRFFSDIANIFPTVTANK